MGESGRRQASRAEKKVALEFSFKGDGSEMIGGHLTACYRHMALGVEVRAGIGPWLTLA